MGDKGAYCIVSQPAQQQQYQIQESMREGVMASSYAESATDARQSASFLKRAE